MSVTTRSEQTAPEQAALALRAAALPEFRRLMSVAAALVGLPVALCLVGGKLWLALSLAGGAALSLLVCGLLYGFVAHAMANISRSLRGPDGAAARGGSMLAFIGLLVGKFALVGLAAYALMSVRHISLPCVLLGFLLAQTAIVVTAARHFRKPAL